MLTINKINRETEKLHIVRSLFREYSNELNENLCFQSFDEELRDPLKKYGSPLGVLLLAFWNDEPAGCVALQPLQNNEVCEMKRLYVRAGLRRHHIGNKLVEDILKEAKANGFKKMVLDTLERLHAAICLYTKNGFTITSAYYENPLPNVVYMEKEIF